MIRTVLVPGPDGSPDPNRQDWWVKTGPSARLVEQAGRDRPKLLDRLRPPAPVRQSRNWSF